MDGTSEEDWQIESILILSYFFFALIFSFKYTFGTHYTHTHWLCIIIVRVWICECVWLHRFISHCWLFTVYSFSYFVLTLFHREPLVKIDYSLNVANLLNRKTKWETPHKVHFATIGKHQRISIGHQYKSIKNCGVSIRSENVVIRKLLSSMVNSRSSYFWWCCNYSVTSSSFRSKDV